MDIKSVAHSLNYKHGSSAPQHSRSFVLFVDCVLGPETMTSLYRIKFRISVSEQRAEFKSSLLSPLQISGQSEISHLTSLVFKVTICIDCVHCIAQAPNTGGATV